MLFRNYRLVGAAKKAGCALGSRQRGRLTSHPERERIVTLIREALAAGARLQRACNEAGICLRTWRRWLRNGEVQADQRSVAAKPVPANKLTPQEREQIIEIRSEERSVGKECRDRRSA